MRRPFLLRKPKFMRNMHLAATYMAIAETQAMLACKGGMTVDEQLIRLKRAMEYMNKSAKAAGFRNMKDYMKWLDYMKSTL